VSGPSPLNPGNIIELQATLKRVLKAGLANLSEDDFDEEALDDDRPGSPAEEIEQLRFDDPRAIDFRNYLRTWSVLPVRFSCRSRLNPFIRTGSDELLGHRSAPIKYTNGCIGRRTTRFSHP
jgi:hypothetical protein